LSRDHPKGVARNYLQHQIGAVGSIGGKQDAMGEAFDAFQHCCFQDFGETKETSSTKYEDLKYELN